MLQLFNQIGYAVFSLGFDVRHLVVSLIVVCVWGYLSIPAQGSRPSSSLSEDPQKSRLLVCSTTHTRFFPVQYSFSYPLLYMYFRIDTPIKTSLVGLDKWRIFNIQSRDYLGAPPCGPSLLEKLRWHLNRHVHLIIF